MNVYMGECEWLCEMQQLMNDYNNEHTMHTANLSVIYNAS